MGIEGFFNAKVFAVVGASRDETKVGNIILKNLSQSKRLLAIPVNPNAKEILGKRCFNDLLEIPYNIDCVVVCVKAEFVMDIINQAAKRKIQNMVIISAGFSESGHGNLEKSIIEAAKKNNITILGPNVLGYLDPTKEINASFFDGIPPAGSIAFLSQSGALGVGALDVAIKQGIGFSGFVSLGNSLQTDFSDFIEYYGNDKNTKVIALYVESLKAGKGKRFIDVCKKCKKPIIALKSGKTSAGSRAAQSHTAALASEQGVYESIFKQAGITEVKTMRELFQVSFILSKYGKIGNRACIITNAGGLGVLTTDYLSENKIQIPQIDPRLMATLNPLLPDGWSHNNPIDILGDAMADRYQNTAKLLDKEDFFDFFIFLLTPQYMTQTMETAQIIEKLDKPAFACFYGGEKINKSVAYLKSKNILVFHEAEDLARILGKACFKEE